MLALSLDEKDSWTELVKRLKKDPQWHQGEGRNFERSFNFADGSSLRLVVVTTEDYSANRKAYVVGLTAHPQ